MVTPIDKWASIRVSGCTAIGEISIVNNLGVFFVVAKVSIH